MASREQPDFNDIIYIDVNSNLYIKDYWVYINKNDELDFFKVNNLNKSKNKKLVNKFKTQGLKAKLIDEEIEKVIGDGDENFIDEDDENNVRHYVQNPETKYVEYYDDYIDDSDMNEEEKQPYFDINGNYKLIDNKKFGLSNYEVYYMNASTNMPIFYTTIKLDNPLYRISVFTNQIIKLNIIGTKIKSFEINITNINNDTDIIITSKLIDTYYTLNI